MKLTMQAVNCGYSLKHTILKDISLTLNTGEICCVLGPNGIGKTTLFKSLLGLLNPLCGDISLDGHSILKWSARKKAKEIAYVAQAHTPPFPYKVKDVVLLGRTVHLGLFGNPTRYDYNLCEEIMKEIGIYHLRDSAYTHISGGERQLVMIAKALVQEPHFLVLDEPTANLDFANSTKIINLLISLKHKGLGIILSTHSPTDVFTCADTTALFTKDKRLLFGPTNEIMTSHALDAAYGLDIEIIDYLDRQNHSRRVCITPLSLELLAN